METSLALTVARVSIAPKKPRQEKPTKLLGFRIVQIWEAGEALQVRSNRGKSPSVGDVAEWLKATVC